MHSRAALLTAAVATAALLASALTASAKDDPAKIKADRDAVRKDLAAKKLHPTADLTYVVDISKFKDTRWDIKDLAEPEDKWQGHMFHATHGSGNDSDPSAAIELNVFKCVHTKQEGGQKQDFQHEFKLWGKSVKMAMVEQIAVGYYEDFMAGATDVSKDMCKSPDKKSGIGPAKYWGCAVGTAKDDASGAKKRMRMDWYVWTVSESIGTFTWWAEVQTAEKFIGKEGWPEKIDEMMKNFKELKDPRLK